MIRVNNKGPQFLIRKTWGQMCFGIPNFSDFRTAVRFMYQILRDIASRLWDSTVLSKTLLFLQRNVWIFTRRETKTDTTDTSSCKPRVVWFKTSGFQSFSDFGIAVKGLWTCSDTWKSSNDFQDHCVCSVQRVAPSEDYGLRIQRSIPGKNKVYSVFRSTHTVPCPCKYTARWVSMVLCPLGRSCLVWSWSLIFIWRIWYESLTMSLPCLVN